MSNLLETIYGMIVGTSGARHRHLLLPAISHRLK